MIDPNLNDSDIGYPEPEETIIKGKPLDGSEGEEKSKRYMKYVLGSILMSIISFYLYLCGYYTVSYILLFVLATIQIK